MQLARWSEAFRTGEITVEDVQDRFVNLREEDLAALSPELRKAVAEARQTLDSIRYGMCEAGQAGEIAQIFNKLCGLVELDRSCSTEKREQN